MNLMLLLLVPAAASAPTVTTYDAIVATEEERPVNEMIVPAIVKGEAKKLGFAIDGRSIA